MGIEFIQAQPRIFIGSSKENLDLARALQENLYVDFKVKIWDQNVTHISQYFLEALIENLANMDYGVFILAPNDMITIRGKKQLAARDNVIYELGIFTGRLGRDRTFIVMPRGISNFHLPSDLQGLTFGDYVVGATEHDLVSSMGPVSNKIRTLIQARSIAVQHCSGLLRCDLFPSFTNDCSTLIRNSNKIDLYFIHSRRWRETHHDDLKYFLEKPKSQLTVYLPDIRNKVLMASIIAHFDDGQHIPSFIADAYRYFADLKEIHNNKIETRLFIKYPTYSFYRFDEKSLVAMYSVTSIRKSVPAFLIKSSSLFDDFLLKDLEVLVASTKIQSISQLRSLITRAIKPDKSLISRHHIYA